MRSIGLLFLLVWGPLTLLGANPAAAAARDYVESHQLEIIQELIRLLEIPNTAANLKDLQRNADFLASAMVRRGIETRVVARERAPLVIGHLKKAGASRTVLIYAHYDGQPVDPAKWDGGTPFLPILRTGDGNSLDLTQQMQLDPDWRLYARSAADDKAPIIAMLTALDALDGTGLTPTSNLIFLFEGEEEAGSTNLEGLLHEFRNELAADAILVADGPVFLTGQPTLYFGARGITTLELTVYGPNKAVHSGHFGNWAPNPGLMLSRLISSMKNDEGMVLVEGFYRDVLPLDAEAKYYISQIPEVEESLKNELDLSRSEGGRSLMEAINLPSLNVRGMSSAWIGAEARTIVPSEATASIDLRLVEEIDPQEQVERVTEHIRKQGFLVVSEEPTSELRRQSPRIARVNARKGYPAHRTDLSHPFSSMLIKTMGDAFADVIVLPTLGGSVPLYKFREVLGNTIIVGIPIVNPDNNQHGPNENLRIGNLFSGIEIFAVLFSMN